MNAVFLKNFGLHSQDILVPGRNGKVAILLQGLLSLNNVKFSTINLNQSESVSAGCQIFNKTILKFNGPQMVLG